MDHPYLSVVAVSRNDDHGANLLARMHHFIHGLSEEVSALHIPTELILVEWNPPTGRPSLRDALDWPPGSEFLETRIITVPREVHARFPHSETLPLFQMIGKNAGIRRARGKFVLATNIDVLFSGELMNYLSSRNLRDDRFYRATRLDVNPAIPEDLDLAGKLEFCRNHIIRVNSRYFLGNASNLQQVISHVVRHPGSILYYSSNFYHKMSLPRLFYNACGDFTLMARSRWEDLRGYPELPMYSLHIDSLFLMLAAFSGLKEEVLHRPCELYHIEHSPGSGITPGEGQQLLFQRLERDRIPFLSWNDCVKLAKTYRGQRDPNSRYVVSNPDSWGLARDFLPEEKIGRP